MSGPIIRKYGFPNFEKIFGERELKHGGEADASNSESAPASSETKAETETEQAPPEAEDPKKPAS